MDSDSLEQIRSLARFPDENPNPILRISNDGVLLYANRPAEALLEHWTCSLNECVPDYISAGVQKAQATGEPVDIEEQVGNRTIAVTFAPVVGAGYVNLYCRDITERREAESQIQQLARFPGENPNPILRVSSDGVIIYANERSDGLLESWKTTRGGRLPDRLASMVQAVRDAGEHREVEEVCGDRIFALVLAPIADADYVNVYGQDVTHRREAEAMARARDRAVEANKAKSAFLANMSHELRTPMNAIIGYSEMMLEDAEDDGNEAMAEDLKRVIAAGKHLLSLINEVLDLSKIESGRMDLFLEEFDVRQLLGDVETTVQPLIAQNENELAVQCDLDDTTMRADLTKMRQALLNLLSNAAKFTQSGTIRVEVVGEEREGKPWARFRVIDSGIGMTPEQLSRVFDAFSQADESTTRKYGGTGLGLTITKRFIEMMGGEITVTSTPGEGTTFELHMPVRVGEKAERPVGESRKLPAMDPEHIAVPDTGGRNTVLVIDDDPDVQELMRSALERSGVSVVTAADGETGIELARRIQPVVITLDIRMPGQDGWAVLGELKSNPETAAIPVIVATIVDEKNLGFAMGASEYLTKPIDRNRLTDLVRKYQCADDACSVLVVDDDKSVRDVITRTLQGAGWSTVEATNGEEGLAKLEAERPALILLDLMMPVMDGFQFLERLRSHEQLSTTPVVVVTAKDLSADDKARLDGSIERILQKGSYTRDELLREVTNLLANGDA